MFTAEQGHASPVLNRFEVDADGSFTRNGEGSRLAMSEFYDGLANLYHLIFQDWDKSIERQAGQLSGIIEERWGAGMRHILDVSCGIGTQAIGLAQRGFLVTASDLSHGAISRAEVEAQRRGVEIDFSVCDMRTVHAHHQRQFDVVSCSCVFIWARR